MLYALGEIHKIPEGTHWMVEDRTGLLVMNIEILIYNDAHLKLV